MGFHDKHKKSVSIIPNSRKFRIRYRDSKIRYKTARGMFAKFLRLKSMYYYTKFRTIYMWTFVLRLSAFEIRFARLRDLYDTHPNTIYSHAN